MALRYRKLPTKPLLASLAMAIVLTGCGDGEDDDTSSSSRDSNTRTPATPVLSVKDVPVNEGSRGRHTISVPVSLSVAGSDDITFEYELIPETAVAGEDFEDVSGTATIAAGQRSYSLGIPVMGDNKYEPDETFKVRIFNPQNAKLETRGATARVTLLNDDQEPTLYFTQAEQTVSEMVGSANVTLALSNPSGYATGVSLSVSGTATRNQDYEVQNLNNLSIPPGETSLDIPVTILQDTIPEGGETVHFFITDLNHAAVPDARSGLSGWHTLIIAGDVGLNDTGVRRYSDGLGNFDLTTEPPTAPMQDASVGRDTMGFPDGDGLAGFSFTKLDNNGNPLPASASTWRCVQDNVTGLVWEAKSSHEHPPSTFNWQAGNYVYSWYVADNTLNGGSAGYRRDPVMKRDEPATSECAYLYDETRKHPMYCNTTSYIQEANYRGLCGFTDWRLPNVPEMRSIYAYESVAAEARPDVVFFPNAPHTTGLGYWTSTPAADNTASSWCIDTTTGDARLCQKGLVNHLRLVRNQ